MIRSLSLILLLIVSSLCAAEVPTYDARRPQGDGVTLVGRDMYKCNRDDYVSQVRFKNGIAAPEVERLTLD